MRLLVLIAAVFVFTGVTADETIDYQLPDLAGNNHALADYKGKWVIVNYWATWCPPCMEEIPDLVDFHERRKDTDAVVLGVNFEEIGTEQLTTFAESFLISYPVLRSEPMAVTPLGPIPGLPTTFIINPDGKLVARQVGPVTGKMLDDYIKKKGKQQAGSAGSSRALQ